ncbi:nitrile hydratase subunit beta [Hoeflea prorocentri]|uniref:Nitrile hydratase subunit beta n=1 Tax=Hoeflea prorocentri TaxID=1922333 RepID=A0A9X3UEL4_9HYPH|nr:nitrile hydratase subunit beta [Hoeflea prorocentri]MCY6379983.1 nitrile hydratase subunit beta [Hoeflea prorocentri]MDA5397783.1 nitrile hydratase subunit beta [Hoeflea prorocentri]
MNGPHDLGGRMGFGPVLPEADEPVFHAEWEKRALGATLCCGALGLWNIDESRHARECLHPADYYSSSYYEIWTKALEVLLVRHGCVTGEELETGHAKRPSTIDRPALKAQAVPETLARGGPCDRPASEPVQFAVGDRVRVRNLNPQGHTRIPCYAKGKVGAVEEVAGVYVFPDDNAHGRGENPQWLYRVVLTGRELWGEDGDPNLTVSIDAWESYLERA